MRMNFLKITAGLFCAGVMMNTAFADFSSNSNGAPPSTAGGYGSSSSVNPVGGYSSDNTAPPSTVVYNTGVSAPPSTTAAPVPQPHHKKHDRFSISLNIPGTDTVVTYREPKQHGKHHNVQPYWVPMQSGQDLPVNTVIGGGQFPNTTLYVCRANYRGGVHPGKYFSGNCNISWGGREMVMTNFEVLVSPTPLAWVGSSNGGIPHHALPGGTEHHQTLYICQADYQNGTHTGKIIGRNCNFGWGGREISVPNYNVLVG